MTPQRKQEVPWLWQVGLALCAIAILGIWNIDWIEEQMARIWVVVGLLAFVVVYIVLFLHHDHKFNEDGR